MDDNEFESQVREPQEVKIIDDQQLLVLPTNEEEEKEEILLTNTAVETTKTKMSFKAKSSERRRRNEISSLETRKLPERHTAQLALYTKGSSRYYSVSSVANRNI
jgi:hypothetical protein